MQKGGFIPPFLLAINIHVMKFNELFYYRVFTLVDITPTQVHHTNDLLDKDLKRNQQRNWDTIQQTLGLRCQIFEVSDPVVETHLVDSFYFGVDFNGEQKVWSFSFGVDRPDVFQTNTFNPVGALFLDFDQVPIIVNLTETAKFQKPVLRTHGTQKNITFTKLENGK